MNYRISSIEIPLETAKIIEFEAVTLCEIIEAVPDYNKVYQPDTEECKKNHEDVNFDTCRVSLDLVIMERWGNACLGYKIPTKIHRAVILEEGEVFTHIAETLYRPTLSRCGKFRVGIKDYYLFQVKYEY